MISDRISQRDALIAGFLGWTLDAFDFFTARSVSSAPVPGLMPKTEPCQSDSLSGDLAEGPPSSWESAWIDLGGEG